MNPVPLGTGRGGYLKKPAPLPSLSETDYCPLYIYLHDTFFTLCLLLLPIVLLLVRRSSAKEVPPGSLGLPIIGQSISFLRAKRSNTAEECLQERVRKYGPVSKLSLFGKPAVFIYGQAANKLIFASDGSAISNQQARSNQMILGDRNLLELSGEDHKRVRNALSSFLKPESLKQYVGKMDAEVRKHLEMHWQGKQNVTVHAIYQTLPSTLQEYSLAVVLLHKYYYGIFRNLTCTYG